MLYFKSGGQCSSNKYCGFFEKREYLARHQGIKTLLGKKQNKVR